MRRPPRTALVLPVPAADPLLAAVAADQPDAVRAALPAHLTALYPFVPPDRLTAATVRACAEIAERTAPIPVRFTGCRVRPGLVYLAPEPEPPVRSLVDAVRGRWPELPPYGGRYPDSPPHVTLALDLPASAAADVARLVAPLLPISALLDELLLVASDGSAEAGDGSGDGWAVRERLPLGAVGGAEGGGAGRTA